MDILKNLAAKIDQQEILRHKIYKVCYQYLNPKSDKELTSDIISALEAYDLSDLNELSAPCLIYEAGNEINLPSEVIYWHFPYLEYYECDDPKPINVKIFTDIFIELFEAYQLRWQEFKELSQQEQEVYYNKIYNVIEKYMPLKSVPFSPHLWVNVGGYGVRGYQAKKMITEVAKVMGLNTRNISDTFDDNDGFDLPIVWYHAPIYLFWGIVFIILGIISLVLHILFYSIKWIITKKWGLSLSQKYKFNPLTAKDFADKMIRLRLMRSFRYNAQSKGQHND